MKPRIKFPALFLPRLVSKANLSSMLLLVAASVLMAPCHSQAAGKKNETLYYEVKLTCPDGNMGVRKMYMKDGCFTWITQTRNLGQQGMGPITLIKNKDGAFLIDPHGMWVGKYPQGSNRESPMVYLPGPTGDVKAFLAKEKALKAGREKIGANTCDVYTYREKVTNHYCKLWVNQKTSVPEKLLILGGRKQDSRTATYLAYKIGCPIDDAKFVLPDKVPIRPIPKIYPKNLPQVQPRHPTLRPRRK